MRVLIAALALALLAGSAHAQHKGRGHGAPQNVEQQKAEQEKKKAAEEAYKAALSKIPDAPDKFDPWRGAR